MDVNLVELCAGLYSFGIMSFIISFIGFFQSKDKVMVVAAFLIALNLNAMALFLLLLIKL